MVRNYKKKGHNVLPRYTEEDLVNAVNDVLNHNETYRQAKDAYNVPIAVIYHRIKGRKNPLTIMSTGRRPALSADVEQTIANCLIARARMGWPCDEKELCILVSEYVKLKNLKTPFKENIPGHDWYLSFMKRHPNLSFKKPEHLQKIRKDARDPFVVYDFYKRIEELFTSKSIQFPYKSSFVFNADESGFSSDPSRVRAIGEKGKTLSRVSGGSGRESTTVLACIAADGSYLPPFIIFKGGAVQARWTSEQAFPGTLYGASKNGWMEEPHFFHWFETSFIHEVKSRRVQHNLPDQTAILLFDGHCSHVSVRIVDSALKANIALFRFPSHLTDRIQPLDKCVFGPVKIKWDRILVEYGKSVMGKSSGRLSKQKFVELLGKVWNEGITPANVISGFKTTGIFPVNSNMFPEEYFDSLKLEKYKSSNSNASTCAQCLTQPVLEPVPGISSMNKTDIETPLSCLRLSPKEPALLLDLPQKPSPNKILHLFSQKLQEAATNTASDILATSAVKTVTPRLRQSTYGEVLTTPEVLKKLQEAEQKKKIKSNIGNKFTKICKSKNEKKQGKRRLKFSSSKSESEVDIHSIEEPESDSDDLPLSKIAKGVNKKIPSKEVPSDFYREVRWDDIKADTFLLVKFKTSGRKAIEFKYVCVVQGKDEEDGEIAIVGLKSVDERCTDFFINEITTSYISINDVLTILPHPKTNFLERKIIHSFPGKVDIFEKA